VIQIIRERGWHGNNSGGRRLQACKFMLEALADDISKRDILKIQEKLDESKGSGD